MAEINCIGIISIIVFYILIFVVGIIAAKIVRKRAGPNEGDNNEEMMVGRRNIGMFVGFFTMTATWVGGGYINGTAEIVATPGSGLIWCQAPVGYALSLGIGGLLFAKRLRREGYITVLDPFQKRFGLYMGGLLFIPALLGEVFWSSAVLAALGATISVILNLSEIISLIVSAAIAIIYTMFGGLYSVAYTDIVQLICIFVGLWLSVPFALLNKAVTPLPRTASQWLGQGIPLLQIPNYVDLGVMLIFGGIPWQAYFQRVLSSSSAKIARNLSIISGFGCLIMAIPSILIGAIAFSTDWNQTAFPKIVNNSLQSDQYKNVLPIVLQYLCPVWVSFFGLGAVSAAVMSSADSSILSASSMFTHNIVKLILWKSASDRQLSWTVRGTIVVVGVLSCCMGIWIQSIYALWILCSDLIYVINFPQLFCVIYIKFTNTYGSLSGFIVGLFFRLASGEPLIGLPALIKFPLYQPDGNQWFPIRFLAMSLSFITIVAVSALTHFLFQTGRLSKKFDIFKCEVNFDLDKPNKLSRSSQYELKGKENEVFDSRL